MNLGKHSFRTRIWKMFLFILLIIIVSWIYFCVYLNKSHLHSNRRNDGIVHHVITRIVNASRTLSDNRWENKQRTGESRVSISMLTLKNDSESETHNKYVAHGDCCKLSFAKNLVFEQTWLPADMARTFYVFSAYQNNQKVYVIGARLRFTKSARCQIWYLTQNSTFYTMKEETASVRMLPDGQNEKYASTVFECSIQHVYGDPAFISIVKEQCQKPVHLLAIKQASNPKNYIHNFTVCLSPLYYNYHQGYELVEWIELNRILGADHFVVYNISVAKNVEKILRYYSQQDLLDVVNWHIPMRVKTHPEEKVSMEIHYFGQTAALNDCLFRTKPKSEYLVNLDLDEFIIPHSSDARTWKKMLESISESPAVYLFRSSYFRKEWVRSEIASDGKDLAERFKLITLRLLEREERIFPPRQRSKYIARTANVNQILIHEVPSVKSLTVPVEIGLVHHYRNWSNFSEKNIRVVDATVKEKYSEELIARAKHIWNIFGEKEME